MRACLVLLAVVLALVASGHAAIVYPQVALGGGYETVITVTNPTDEPWTGQLSFKRGADAEFPAVLKADGQTIGATSQWTVGPRSTARYLVTAEADATSGYLLITTQSGPPESEMVTAVFFRLRDSAGTPMDLIGSYPAKPARKMIFPIDRSATSDTGIAFLTPGNSVNSILFTLKNASGLKVQDVRLARSGQVALMASELFNQLPKTFLGSVTVESSEPLNLLVLRLEMSQGIQLTGTVPLPLLALTSEADVLPFDPITLQYSKALDRIVALAANPDRLWVYDAEARTAQPIDLSAPPADLSVSPDGLFAAVAQTNGSVAYVDLLNRKVDKTIPVTTPFAEIVLGGNGFVYLIQSRKVTSVRISDGQQTSVDFYGAPESPFGRFHPGQNAIYVTDEGSGSRTYKFEIQEGVAKPDYESSGSSYQGPAAQFEISEDGQRLFSSGGDVFRASAVPSQDMTPNGRVPSYLAHFADSDEIGRIAVIPRVAGSAEAFGTEVWIHDYATLERRAAFSLPVFPADTIVPSRGRYVFYNSAGTKLLVVVEANPSLGLTSGRYGVVTYDVADLEN